MKVLVVGLGSIGRRHAGILKQYFGHDLYAYRSGSSKRSNDLDINEVHSWSEVEGVKPDVAFITNPTFLHLETAQECALRNMHLFIEKPLSNTLKGVDEVKNICRDRKLTSYVAYNMRFHPVVKQMKHLLEGKQIRHVRVVGSSYLPDWRKGQDHLNSYSASSAQGGGVLLDLSHEFDYITHLFGRLQKIEGKFGRLSDVTLDAEDYADLIITLDSGVVVNLHINLMSLLPKREVVVDYKGGYCTGDLLNYRLIKLDSEAKEELSFNPDTNAAYREQIAYFFDNLGKPEIMNSLEEAEPLLKKILDFKNG